MIAYALEGDVVVYLKAASDGGIEVRAQRLDGSGDAEIVRLRTDGKVQRIGNLAVPLGFVASADGFVTINNPQV